MSITVNSAIYGTLRSAIDVTQICQTLVDSGNDDITANNANFTDPDVGVGKTFTINYTNGGSTMTLGCAENTTLDLVPIPPVAPTPPPSTTPVVTIVKALFGSSNQGWDVTQTCQWLVANGATAIQADIGTFGDPDPGNLKTFSVIYSGVGSAQQYLLCCAERTTLNLPIS